ncbi:hypothetical protein [Desulfosarcina sp.]|uniref:hypothetical protein n=1 Tax=Desulfosarcina sp. TaxID=2027861 RepID=UPI003564FE8F
MKKTDTLPKKRAGYIYQGIEDRSIRQQCDRRRSCRWRQAGAHVGMIGQYKMEQAGFD